MFVFTLSDYLSSRIDMSFTLELFAQMSRRKRSKSHFALRGPYHFSIFLFIFMGVLAYFCFVIIFVFIHTKLQNVTSGTFYAPVFLIIWSVDLVSGWAVTTELVNWTSRR